MTALTRRGLLAVSSALIVPSLVPRSAMAVLAASPSAAEGPFYPVTELADIDNDLIRVADAVTQAGGEILYLTGTLRDTDERRIAGARIEIWQCDSQGIYLHPRDRNFTRFDRSFQGFGHTITDTGGRFDFRTILPVPYPGRTPHIHLKALVDGRELFNTQFYRAGHPLNARDGLFNRMNDAEKLRVSMDVTPFGEERLQAIDALWRADIEVVLGA